MMSADRDFTDRDSMTCEMRRAIEYGIDEAPTPIKEDKPVTTLNRGHAMQVRYAELAAQLEPGEPHAMDFSDPIAFSHAYHRWATDNPEAASRSHMRRVARAGGGKPAFRDFEYPYEHNAFMGKGEGENR